MSRSIAGAQLPSSMIDDIPDNLGGVYLLYKKKGQSKVCEYIGSSESFRSRLKGHSRKRDFDFFSYVKLTKKEMGLIEPFLIVALNPFRNEKMEVKLDNVDYTIKEPQIFRGYKDLFRYDDADKQK